MVQDTPSRYLDKIVVRLPDGLKERIKAAADANKRSVNQELVSTLEAAYPEPDPHELAMSMFTMLTELVQLREKHGYAPGDKDRANKAGQRMMELVGKQAGSPPKEDFFAAWLEFVEAVIGEPIEGLDPAEREKLLGNQS